MTQTHAGGPQLKPAQEAASPPPAASDHLPEEQADQALDWAIAATGKQAQAEADSHQPIRPDTGVRADVQAQYGTRPKSYERLFDSHSAHAKATDEGNEVAADREARFRAALPSVVTQLNAVAEARGYSFRFTEAELATNFITEGGYYLLSLFEYEGTMVINDDKHFSGFDLLGIDTFLDRREELDPWMSDDLRTHADDEANALSAVNEKGGGVNSVMIRDLEQGVEANAVMFAAARKQFSDDCDALKLTVTAPEAWFFWTTVYYNAGEGTGVRLLKKHGIDYWKQKWTLPDDSERYGRNVKYNATWRTATWESIRTQLGDDLSGAEQ